MPPIPITLTSDKNPRDRRFLNIKQGEPVLIGRASKSEVKNLQAASENALFDCPVVSRRHAELRAHPWAPYSEQITIIDMDSMHGTSVNGQRLRPGERFFLHSGDHLKFGDMVTRGHGEISLGRRSSTDATVADIWLEETHDGVIVEFERRANTSLSETLSSGNPAKGFNVPSESGDECELSDQYSEDDISVISGDDEEHPSSAKTTPEQGKVKLGSQEEPIDLEATQNSLREVINLDSEEDALARRPLPQPQDLLFPPGDEAAPKTVPEAVPFTQASQQIVEDSIDKTAADGIRSVPVATATRNPDLQRYGITMDLKDEADAEASLAKYDTGLTSILSHGNEDDVDAGADNEDEANEDEDHDEDDEHEYGYGFDADEPVDNLSDSDASDLDNYNANSRCSEIEDEGEDEEPLMVFGKPTSPELGSQEDQPSATTHSVDFYTQSSMRPHYDPIRGLNPPPAAPAPHSSSAGAAHKLPSSYTYGYPGNFWGPVTGYDASSRWDVPPPPPPPPAPLQLGSNVNVHSNFQNQPSPTDAVMWACGARNTDDVPKFSASDRNCYRVKSSDLRRLDPYQPFGFGHDHHFACTGPSIPQDTFHEPPPTSNETSTKTRLSIDNLVAQADMPVSQTEATVAGKSILPTGSKRKAEEMSAHDEIPVSDTSEMTESEWAEVFNLRHDLVMNNVGPARPAKKTKRQSVAAEISKGLTYSAIGGLAGGLATFGFLCSPLAEKLLDLLA